MSIEVDIFNGLMRAVNERLGNGLTDTVEISYPNIEYEPIYLGKWIEVLYFPNDTISKTWGNEKFFQGILRLNLHWPADDGAENPMITAAEVLSFFPKGSDIFEGEAVIRIYDHGSISTFFQTGQSAVYSITIMFRVYG
jgi:hypothetical protein